MWLLFRHANGFHQRLIVLIIMHKDFHYCNILLIIMHTLFSSFLCCMFQHANMILSILISELLSCAADFHHPLMTLIIMHT